MDLRTEAVKDVLCYFTSAGFEERVVGLVDAFAPCVDQVIDEIKYQRVEGDQEVRDARGRMRYSFDPRTAMGNFHGGMQTPMREPGDIKRLKIFNKSSRRFFKTMIDRDVGPEGARSRVAAATTIARFWSRYRSLPLVNQTTDDEDPVGLVTFMGKAVICPITQDTIPRSEQFRLVTTNFEGIAYSRTALAEYLYTTVNFTCPCTRSPIEARDVTRLADRCKDWIKENRKPDLLSLYNTRFLVRREAVNNSNQLLAYESACAEDMTRILDEASDLTRPTRNILRNILNQLLPEWNYHVNSLRSLDYDTAYSMLLADREKLRRLQENVVVDPHELLQHVVAAVNQQLGTPRRRATAGVFQRMSDPQSFAFFQPASLVNPSSTRESVASLGGGAT